jgi:hypothetical protein
MTPNKLNSKVSSFPHLLPFITPTLALPHQRLCRNNKNRAQTRRKRRSGGKVLKRQPFTCEIHTFHILEMTPLPTNIDYLFLKDRILRLWNPTVSSTRATIVTQPQGRGRIFWRSGLIKSSSKTRMKIAVYKLSGRFQWLLQPLFQKVFS